VRSWRCKNSTEERYRKQEESKKEEKQCRTNLDDDAKQCDLLRSFRNKKQHT
jgi:hypothetical protein